MTMMKGFEKKCIINILGGLGNQMFQYAFGLAYQQETNIPVVFDTYRARNKNLQVGTKRDMLLDVFQLSLQEMPINISNRLAFYYNNRREHFIGFLLRKLYSIDYKDVTGIKNAYVYDEALLKPTIHSCYLSGHFQNPKYFNKYRDLLLNDFRLKEPVSLDSQIIENKVLGQTIPVAIHIRRGDYLQYDKTFCLCSPAYYREAVKMMYQTTGKNCHFFIFSDDIHYAKTIFSGKNFTFIIDRGEEKCYEDLYLMSICHHNIIANSSFSWWGAWLNNNPNKRVIAPKDWLVNKSLNAMVDIYMHDWIKI